MLIGGFYSLVMAVAAKTIPKFYCGQFGARPRGGRLKQVCV